MSGLHAEPAAPAAPAGDTPCTAAGALAGFTIDGATRLYAIVGDPVAQVRSPAVYTEAFARAGRHALLFAAQVSEARFDEAVRGLMALGNLDGLLVTSPHKARMVPLATRLSPRAALVGAVNALRREADGSWSGEMFDGVGFVAAARRLAPLAGRRALVFGCGGAGAAIAAELAADGVAEIALRDPDRARVARLAAGLTQRFAACRVGAARDDGAAYDLVINASTVGMCDGDPLPGEPGPFTTDTIVGDVVLRPEASPTALVARARQAGARIVTGRDMHAGQRDAILDFFAVPR